MIRLNRWVATVIWCCIVVVALGVVMSAFGIERAGWAALVGFFGLAAIGLLLRLGVVSLTRAEKADFDGRTRD
jgi:hypothetical protein